MMRKLLIAGQVLLLALLLQPVLMAAAQDAGGEKPFKQEELDQMLAPLALYPDSLLSQILMASTYPLEVVQAARWADANKSLKDDALTAALEKQDWDPSVKSLVAFPDVLKMMNDKLDWTTKLGDAFLAQQKDVMDTVQNLRKKAQAAGNLATTKEQKVVVEKETQVIVIESADPKVVYVPAYNPTVVYGAWWWPSYPPPYYYPYGYVPGAAAFGFCAGVAMGAAWGYAWGGCNWGHGCVDVDINNVNFNNANINRDRYKNNIGNGSGRGQWQHSPEHRKGAAYRDNSTAQRFDKGLSREAQSRDAFRGRAEAGRKDIAAGGADQFRGRGDAGSRGKTPAQQPAGAANRGGAGQDRGGVGQNRGGAGRNDSAFGGYDRGNQVNAQSNRGRDSLSSSSRSGSGLGSSGRGSSIGSSGGGRSSGGFGGGGRGGGGRGGGRR